MQNLTDIDVLSVRQNAYFKGGKDDNFISGIWIGNELQEKVLFVNCTFNGVIAKFKECVFIDCVNPPIVENCVYIQLPYDKRVIAQYRNANNTWG